VVEKLVQSNFKNAIHAGMKKENEEELRDSMTKDETKHYVLAGEKGVEDIAKDPKHNRQKKWTWDYQMKRVYSPLFPIVSNLAIIF